MLAWNLAKSAEEKFFRWSIKHVCKFLLKKKLGKFILGDLDLNQLEVQLGDGTITLSDLALNVDYLNEKLGVAPVIVKEGSIGSLLVRIPWKVKNCQIEVEELELVLGPRTNSNLPVDIDKCTSSEDGKQHLSSTLEKLDFEKTHESAESLHLDVHEGVKTIAKMVKWLLTSFHVKVKNLIVAFDPLLEKDEKRPESQRTLVFRISETEYGTCFSEDASTISDSRLDSFLGMSRLTNFVKFQGAIVEFLEMEDVDNHLPLSGSMTPILTGEIGGFSGTLKLSIPWKNGSLDIRKVDADICIEPMLLRLQPGTINWIISLWECLKNVGMDASSNVNCKAVESLYLDSSSRYHSSTLGSAVDRVATVSEKKSAGLCSLMSQETLTDGLLPQAHLILDWVPMSINKNQKDTGEGDSDYGASIDQFFECFDGMRNSQAALGNSGIWNWTCSVFSAITAASSLASGSVHIPSEQQHVETNLKVTIVGISVILSFHDVDQNLSSDLTSGHGSFGDLNEIKNKSCSSGNVVMPSLNGFSADSAMPSTLIGDHYLEAKCRDLLLTLQISPQKMEFDAMIKHIEVDDCFDYGSKAVDFGCSDREKNIFCQMILFQRLQAEVQAALPPLPFYAPDPKSKETINVCGNMESPDGNVPGIGHKTICRGEIVKVKLLQTLGDCGCQVAVSSISSDNMSRASTSFSVKLPPFILWVNFQLINALLDFYKKVGNSFESNKKFRAEVSDEKHDLSYHGDVKTGACTYVKTVSPKTSVQGNIYFPHARTILCFPFESHGDFKHFCPWDEFVGLDFSPSLSMDKVAAKFPIPTVNSSKGYSDIPSSSINLNFGDLNVYLITSTCSHDAGKNSCHINKQTFSAEKIMSVVRATNNHYSGIRMFWQAGPVTGPWIASKARRLACSHVSSRSKVTGNGYEFASVTTVEDLETNCRARQEMILSSALVLQIYLAPVRINLGASQYRLLHRLLNQVMDGMSSTLNDSVKSEQAYSSNGNSFQASVLVECDVVDLSLHLENEIDIKCSMQKELSGSWDSLRLTIEKFELLTVSNIGGITGANFVWVSHDEGELWGSLTGINDVSGAAQDFLLISCKNSAMCRGDGEGNNALSSGSAGTVIIHMWDPQSVQSFTSVTVRCGTIVAPGGRLDWFNEICNFFSLPPCENEQAGDDKLQNEIFEDNASCEASFFLDLVDIALSYEPHIKINDGFFESDCESSSKPIGESGEQYVGCLLASALLNFSSKTVADAASSDYKIRLQDVGLLLCGSPGFKTDRTTYAVGYLRRSGYVKVAGEALVEAILKTNCDNGLLWELECSESHVNLDTCHDTTAGLIRLLAQLQQLFAPDIEESIVHLQTRWNTVQQGITNSTEIYDSSPGSPAIHGQPLNRDVDSRSAVVGLMDEILEDAFYLNGNLSGSSDSRKVQPHISLDGTLTGDGYNLNISTASACDVFPLNVSFNRSISGLGLESVQASSSLQNAGFPEFIEGYYISELVHLSQLSANNHSLNEKDFNCKSKNAVHTDAESGRAGWYKESSLKIVEDHISNINDKSAGKHIHEKDTLPSINSTLHGESCKPKGRILLKNINVRWRMYGGSDWPNSRENDPLTMKTGGRDTTVCLELTLSGMNLHYDMFPDGEIYVSKLSLSIQDFHLYDNSMSAPWKMVLGYYHSKDHPRESCAKAFKLDLEAVRPDRLTPLEEYRLRLALLPVVLHLDQGQLDFLISFFACKDSSTDHSLNLCNDMGGSRMMQKSGCFGGQTIVEEALLPFFQKCDIWPAVVRVDYTPRHIDLAALQGGNYAELLNLVPWKGIELQLKHVHAVGVYGWSSVCQTIIGEWLEDISHNQVHKLLKGLAPIRSLFAVGSGAAKLVSLPVKNYRKDRRLLKGMQRGAIAFLRSISLEAVGLGVHLAAGAHDILLQTEYILTSIPPSVPMPVRGRPERSVRSNQPKDAQQGIQQAYESLSDGLGKAANALVGNPLKTYQRGAGAASALLSAVRSAPAAAIAPASATARAAHCALLGVRNSLNPELKKESIEKYSGPTKPRDRRK
ncbi:autophagy 2 [Tasmannia lanceolata]|uniref:autophagy 2 n=1 Tax=Tasmannia lanceolata TaxID=3420 RepID=UPI0040638C13